MIGQTLKGTYKLYDKVGSGGFATVYLGRNLRTNQIVAVKVLKEESAEVPGMVERFRREAQLIQGLDHPKLVRVLDYGVEDGRHFLVMEYVQGKTLAQVIAERGPLPVEQTVRYVTQVCGALAHAHQRGIVHRDIKPGNLMVTPEGVVKVMDFGIAKIAAITALTHSGQTMGTPRYMSPEMIKGEPVDARGDIYSLGVVLYELLAGQAPFDAESPWTVMRQHIETPPRPIGELRRGLPAWLEAAVARTLAKDPAARFQTPAELAAALEMGRARMNAGAVSPSVPPSPATQPVARPVTPLPTTNPAGQMRADTPRPARGKAPVFLILAVIVVALALVGVFILLPALKSPPAQVEPPLAPPAAPAVQPTATLAQGTIIPPVRETPGSAVPLTPSATLQPTDINTEPTATLAPIAAPTNTAAPRPATATLQTGRGGVTPTAPSRRVPPPVLGDPNGATVSGRITFSWGTGGYGLRQGEGYALLVWKADDPGYQGKSGLDLPSLFDACAVPYIGLSFEGDPGAINGPGDYNWTVVVVDMNRKDATGRRCVVISDQPGPHRFTYAPSAPSAPVTAVSPTPIPPP